MYIVVEWSESIVRWILCNTSVVCVATRT